MNFKFHAFATVTFPSPSSNPTSKALVPPNLSKLYLLNRQNPKPRLSIYKTLESAKCPRLQIRATANNQGESGNWTKWLPRGVVAADRILRLISSATSSPISQFISSPTTFLHSVDPRIKLVWLLALVLLPARSHIIMRFGLVVYLACLSVWILPTQVWMDQLGRVSFLSGLLFIMLGLGSDGAPPLVQLRTPPPAMMGLPNLPDSLGGYSYLVMKLGPLQLTRKGLSVASTAACLTFTIFQSASLCLTTTTPEQLASALWWFMRPLRFIGVPVAEITLTLLLSLRFISLVFDEVRNVALGIISRRINWQQLTTMETIDIFVCYVRRIFKNIFSHAEQISQAMIVRGFRGDSSTHKLYFLSDSSIRMEDVVSLLCLIGIIGAAVLSEYLLV
ncbi:protein ABCI12, chloroplastic isoform X1 [Vitis riparia]|uniref:protein ABCI12, chloroplastic isoform X1 n=1 Tax=Vitis riparia TaxID=96939 RepID=UPI00155A0D15|nr:protein ABCI12, chloroplastic isoform X1 [Vitis riparia]